ncbi:hypothetical protein DENIS_4705 [Desulfonema ishimotonii]|uniref:Uncharacterized protein n=1 Tax=Desulfonema ishimotonii TaxID=45657 RepID=A0A401G392_9BACT|nr:hypothetical protein [Desulfonema ishimotonii]GBC63707.1 hypothetical protein DENIS_4705 [Desulfonema ishimotonii]
MTIHIEFKVGEKYENMKGMYEVLSIDGDSMIIRWDSGEETSTPIELQRKIILRLESEKRQRENAAQAKKKSKSKSASSRYGSGFSGMELSDFKKDVKGTTWRNRNCLGGAVTNRLTPGPYAFNSWAIYRSPEIQWADTAHRKRDSRWLQAKFFAEIDEASLCFGFYIERADNDQKSDWTPFMSWLENDGNEEWLISTLSEHDLRIYDPNGAIPGAITSFNGKWRLSDGGNHQEIPALNRFLHELPGNKRVDLHIGKKVDKDEAIARGETLADDISMVLNTLMPLYEAATPAAE